MNKASAVIKWLSSCPYIGDLYFNFSESGAGDTVFAPDTAYSDEWADGSPFIDGSGDKIYTFSLIRYEPVSFLPNSGENEESLADVQNIAAWIDLQAEKKNYPVFPKNCTITDMEVLPFANGGLAGADELGAKFMFSIQISYYYEKEQ